MARAHAAAAAAPRAPAAPTPPRRSTRAAACRGVELTRGGLIDDVDREGRRGKSKFQPALGAGDFETERVYSVNLSPRDDFA
eukprot:4067347-Prymnesium_polylepis.1